MKRIGSVVAVVTAVAAIAAVRGSAQEDTRATKRPFVPVTDEMLMKPSPSDGLMWRRTQDSSGFSPLNQINRTNVGQLRMTWTRGMGATAGTQEGTPIVYSGVMYLRSPGDAFEALDAKTGDMLWQFKRPMAEGARSKTSRAMAIWGTTNIDASSENTKFANYARSA